MSKLIKLNTSKVVVLVAIFFSITSYIWSVKNGYSLVYNDAMSHLDIARLVFDNIEPGFAQLGSVWLPLNHILALSLVWNDWAWHSGFAGSIFSMIAYAISVWGMYKIIYYVTKNKVAAVIGSIAFVLNPNILYLQTTPLTEPLYLTFFILSVLNFIKWIDKNDFKYLFLLGLFGFLQVLTRYDGWFVVGVEGLAILIYSSFFLKEKTKKTIGTLILFSLPIVFGIGLWLLWNLLIYNNSLYFIFGPYSAKSQQTTIETTAGLITKGNLKISILAFWYDVVDNIGKYIVGFSVIGGLIFFAKKNINFSSSKKIFIFLLIFSPIFFNVLSLYLGFSIINVPQLNWNPTGKMSEQWFNVRYGILALPAITFLVGMLANSKKKIIVAIIMLVIIIQSIFIFKEGIVTLIDGTIGSSSFANNDIAQELKRVVGINDKIILSTSFFNAVAFKTGFHLNQFIHEGVSSQWKYALKKPENYAKWIVMANGNVGEPVYNSLIKSHKNEFLKYYKLFYEGNHARIYKLKTIDELFVYRENTKLMIGKKEFKIKGVNSYDLAYRTKSEIADIFKNLSTANVNTIRFWVFGDGFNNGFQPKAGVINEERLERVDFIISMARKYHIYLIPVFVNNWDDYGGKRQYLKWSGENEQDGDLFFLDDDSKKLFENYVNHIVSRKNTITNKLYSNEQTILAWELMNEPRISSDKQKILWNWTQQMSNYLKQIDNNHLVIIGSEEEETVRNDNESKAKNLCALSDIDICSVHLYLFHNKQLIYKNYNALTSFLMTQIKFAKKNNKPILLGELGVPKQMRPFGKNSLNIMQDIISYVDELGYNGFLIWNWSLMPDNSFGFSSNESGEEIYNLDALKELLNIKK